MELRKLGRQGLQVSAVGMGCAGFAGNYGAADDEECIRTIHAAIELGINFFDTSDIYGNGKSEQLIARAIHDRRDRAIVATKFGNMRTGGQRGLTNGRPDYVPVACDESLKRLGVDVIDLYYQHRVDPSVPIEDTVGAMKRLVEQGKVRYLGLCEAAPATIRRAHRIHPISALQSEFSLLYRVEAEATLPTLRELGISFVAYSPLGRSWLAGRVERLEDIPSDDRRRDHPRFHEANFAKNLDLIHRIEPIAKERGCTPGQLALAWLLAQGPDVVPIPGTKRKERLEENVKAASLRLDGRDVERIAEAIPAGAAAGTRYPEPQMKGVHI